MTAPQDKSPNDGLNTPVQFLKGVGPQRSSLLERLGLKIARDVLFFFPRTYQDLSELRSISQLEDGQPVSVCGVIEEVDLRDTGPSRSMLGALIREGSLYLRAVWFNQAYMQDRLPIGRRVLLSGLPKLRGMRWEMAHPRVELLHDDETPSAGRLLPVYPLTEGLNQGQMRRIVQHVVADYAGLLEETFPTPFLESHELWSIQQALPAVHFPSSQAELDHARRRFIYQELLVLQLALTLRKQSLTLDRRSPSLPATAVIDSRIRRLFPFEFTEAQNEAIEEIRRDLEREHPMNRLLQGDVGSGKTVVAMYAMLVSVAHKHQAVLMAPTEVLARQHSLTLTDSLRHGNVRIALLTGSLTAAQRRETLQSIASGEVDLVVGTHAVVQEDVEFAQLGLVVIDEQHKFGVRQRALLKQAGLDPHYLVMTATPIPRTLSMTLFGDLDASTLRTAPPGRQTVHTYLAEDSQRTKWWEFFCKKLSEGRQGFVIAPLVEESDTLEAANVQSLYENLSTGPLQNVRLGLLHGRLHPDEKDRVMQSFRRGQTQVLVATSVVEVGVDVPNATLMTIETGERFGLAQLHQLRGRISRGAHPGFLCVFANPTTEEAQQRLDALVRTCDGFELAELDFQLRGPGDLFGVRQHGLPPLRIADLVRDAEVLEIARRDAHTLIADDPHLDDPRFERLKKMVLIRYGKALDLADVA